MKTQNQNILVVTGGRADFGLLSRICKFIDDDLRANLIVAVTGYHFSTAHGNTVEHVRSQNYSEIIEVELDLNLDDVYSTSNYISKALLKFTDLFKSRQIDKVLVLGDRYEIFSSACAAMVAKIPIAHIHGGELTEGAIDDPIRHSVTKMSHLHFVATNNYKDRVIQLGEHPNRVFNVGGLGVDSISRLKLLSKSDFEKAIDFQLGERNIMVTFHPATLENSNPMDQFQALLDSIESLKNTKIIFTKANSDTNGRVINNMIDDYIDKTDNAVAFKSMGQLNYLSALQFVDAVVGNSSSGLLEAPSFNIGTIDIGDRQRGRIKADSVISCLPNTNSIKNAFKELYSEQFQNKVKQVKNPYGSGGASRKILEIIRDFDLSGVIKKTFYDLKR